MDLELRQLRYFVVLAEELHFGRAAARLRIAQPALSQAIRRLETRLGVSLFARTSRRVELTPAGHVMTESALRVFRELVRGTENARGIHAGRRRSITIAHTALSMLTVLPRVVNRYRRAEPAVRVTFREMPSAAQIEQLLAGYVDVAIIAGEVDAVGLRSLRLDVDPLGALLPASHPLARLSRVRVGALAESPFVLFPRDQIPTVYDRIMGLCRAAGFEPDIVQLAQSWHMVAMLVRLGLGVSIVPATVQRYNVGGTRFVGISPRAVVPTTVVWRAELDEPTVLEFVSASQALVTQTNPRRPGLRRAVNSQGGS